MLEWRKGTSILILTQFLKTKSLTGMTNEIPLALSVRLLHRVESKMALQTRVLFDYEACVTLECLLKHRTILSAFCQRPQNSNIRVHWMGAWVCWLYFGPFSGTSLCSSEIPFRPRDTSYVSFHLCLSARTTVIFVLINCTEKRVARYPDVRAFGVRFFLYGMSFVDIFSSRVTYQHHTQHINL